MRLYVPRIGDRIKLTADWSFDLYAEHRNMDFFRKQHPDVQNPNRWGWQAPLSVALTTLPAGTILRVERVYVRATNQGRDKEDSYDSLTFRAIDPKTGKGVGRFWVKLPDANRIEFETVSRDGEAE